MVYRNGKEEDIMKRIAIVTLLLCLCCAACAAPAETARPVRVGALKGPTAMGMVKMMEDNAGGYQFTVAAAIDEITPALVRGELDISAVPANMASVLYNNTKGQVRVLAINTLGVLYIVENGETIETMDDLRGRSLYASGKGATPEYAINALLADRGINADSDMAIEWKTEHAECVAALVANPGSAALLPQPFVTTALMKNDEIRIALDLNAEWDGMRQGMDAQSALVTGVIVARTAFIEEHPEQVSAFLDAYKASVAYVHENRQHAAELIGGYEIVPAQVAYEALPYCNITFVEGDEMKQKLSGYLAVLMAQNPKAIGGALPDDAFYYAR